MCMLDHATFETIRLSGVAKRKVGSHKVAVFLLDEGSALTCSI
jgi:hypothetical protein